LAIILCHADYRRALRPQRTNNSCGNLTFKQRWRRHYYRAAAGFNRNCGYWPADYLDKPALRHPNLVYNLSWSLALTGAAASTWDIGNNTLSLTDYRGGITTGAGLFTSGGSITFSGTTARSITGPGTGGLSITDTGGAINLTGGASSTIDTGASNTLSLQNNGGPITTGSGQFNVGGNIAFSGSAARTISGQLTAACQLLKAQDH